MGDFTKKQTDLVVVNAINDIFGGHITPMSDVSVPKHRPRNIEYVRPEIITGTNKEKSDIVRRDQDYIGNRAIKAIYDFIGTGNSSRDLDFLGINTEALPEIPKKLVPIPVINNYISMIKDSYDFETLIMNLERFGELYREDNITVSEKEMNKIFDVFYLQCVEIASYTELATKKPKKRFSLF